MLLLAAVAPAVGAQARPDSARRDSARTDSARVAPETVDSLLARLERAESAIALLREQVATESQSTVHTRSRVSVDLSARVLTNVAYTRGGANDPSVPQSASVPGASGDPFFGVSLRQTRFGAAVSVRDVLGATFVGDVDADLFGGGRDANGNRPLFPEPRLRTARGQLQWPRTTVLVGSETPLISDLDPLSLASIGVTQFSGSGDLWNWLGQVRVTQQLGGRGVRWAVQGAVLEPFSSVAYDPARPGGDGGERSGRPFLEGRLRARWGAEDPDAPGGDVRDAVTGEGPSEIGVGVHRGWITGDGEQRFVSSAASLDVRIVLAPRVELRGEAYRGQGLLGLGGGAIGQTFGRPVTTGGVTPAFGPLLHDAAGWAQLNVRPNERWLGGVGCGIDRVRDADRPDRRQNTVCAAHVRWTPVQPLLFGLEYKRMSTLYPTGMSHADHINLAIGFEM